MPDSPQGDAKGHVLVVDDHEEICDLIQQYLSGEGFHVSTANNGAEMREAMARGPVDLVILDLVLRGEDGLAIARELRTQSGIGIIVVTGRGEPVDRIIALEMGADDYLPKPFHTRELLARVRSVLRRYAPRPEPGGMPRRNAGGAPRRLRISGWTLDMAIRELVSPGGEHAQLTAGEFELLAVFVKHANRVLSRDQLHTLARRRETGPFDRTIDVQVGRLRRKLGDDPKNPSMIKTVRGGGYILTAAVEDE